MGFGEMDFGGWLGRGFSARQSLNDRLWSVIHATRDGAARAWRDRRVRRGMATVLSLILVLGGVGVWQWMRPRPVPNVAVGSLDDVLGYTLLSDDFNRLPLNERIRIIKELVARFKGMTADDSALAAAFAAGIAGAAREQLRHNAEKMMVDLWDSYAAAYRNVATGDREAYLDKAFADFTKLAESIGGKERDVSDEQRVADGRSQAQRDAERAKKSDPGLKASGVSDFFAMVHDRGGQVANPEQRGEMALFTRDMTRHLRGEDIGTGKVK